VELKQSFIRSIRYSVALPIEPKWNWNISGKILTNTAGGLPIEPKWNWNENYSEIDWYAPYSSNRTKVELKHLWSYWKGFPNDFQSNQSGIETCKFYRKGFLLYLPIEPKWNWNSLPLHSCKNCYGFQSNQSGIETGLSWQFTGYWNASNRTKVELKLIKWLQCVFFLFFQSNQSGIETKHRSCSSMSHKLPIEPKWNWNPLDKLFVFVASILPIEPKWNWNAITIDLPPPITASNRTKVELKLFSRQKCASLLYFQSNQSGIET